VPILNFQPIQASLEGAFWQIARPLEKSLPETKLSESRAA
jgi:hypothetical protein